MPSWLRGKGVGQKPQVTAQTPREKRSGLAAARADARIWLDIPTEKLALRFDDIASGLAEIIISSEPRFAVGIFGGWGSGKTTLMKAIRKKLEKYPENIVCVDFNAWRFEREPFLLVPLLDTIRGELADWATKEHAGPDNARDAREAALRMARIVRGLAAGLNVEVGLPGAFKIGYDLDKGMKAMRPETATGTPQADQPQSLYFTAFTELAQAIKGLNEVVSVVVFVDDLDRCLPGSALEVLESMKLFFDIPGFIFVAGLDERIVQQAVRAKLIGTGGVTTGPSAGIDANSKVMRELVQEFREDREYRRKLERDYLEKIFQVPYRLPQMTTRALDDLLKVMATEPSAGASFDRDKMRTFLEYFAADGRIIPREVKRFLNTFILQMITHDDDFKPEIVLVLQVLAFRHDWRTLYDEILIDWQLFKQALREYQTDDTAFGELSDDLRTLNPELERYLRSPELRSFAHDDTDLELYLSSLDSVGAGDPGLTEAYRALYDLRLELRRILTADPIGQSDRDQLVAIAVKCASAMSPYVKMDSPFDTLIRQLTSEIDQLRMVEFPGEGSDADRQQDFRAAVTDAADAILDNAKRIPRELRASRGLPTPPAVPDDASERASYAESVLAIVEEALPPGWRLKRQETVSGYQFDGLITSGAGNIVVEAVYNRGFTAGEISRAIRSDLQSEPSRMDAALVVTRSSNAVGFTRLNTNFTAWGMPHRVLEWRPGQEDEQVLTEAVRGLIQELRAMTATT